MALAPVPFPRIPITNITPFTYRNGLTFLELLEALRQYVAEILVGEVDERIAQLVEEYSIALNAIVEQGEQNLTELQNLVTQFKADLAATQAAYEAEIDRKIALINNDANMTASRQVYMYTDFLNRMKAGENFKIVCQGDSLTYGFDTVSADRVPATGIPADDGSVDPATRSPYPWPFVLQTNLEKVYGSGKVNVINRGFSGDDVDRSYTHWTTDPHVDIAIIMLGTNDANRLTVDQFIEGYERILLRYINEFDTPCIIFAPLKNKFPIGSANIDAYRRALFGLGTKFSVPVIDSDTWLDGYSDVYFSDNTHLNTNGNAIVAARAAALFVGRSIYTPLNVTADSTIPLKDPMYSVKYGANAGGGVSATTGVGPFEWTGNHYVTLGADGAAGRVDISFYAETGDLEFYVPMNVSPGADIKISLDFDVRQGSNIVNTSSGYIANGEYVPGSNIHRLNTSEVPLVESYWDASKTLRISNPGWHTITIEGAGTTTAGFLFGLIFRSARVPLVPIGYLSVPHVTVASGNAAPTRIPLDSIYRALGMTNVRSNGHIIPRLKFSVYSSGGFSVDYIVNLTATPSHANSGISHFAEAGRYPSGGASSASLTREIDTLTYDTTTRDVVITWKTNGSANGSTVIKVW